MRQDLVGANYALIEGCSVATWGGYGGGTAGSCRPNPDYWGALLFTRLMGDTVLRVTQHGGGESLRVWGACRRSARAKVGYVLLVLNLANASAEFALPPATGAAAVGRYVLTPWDNTSEALSAGGLRSQLRLNGEKLELLPHAPWLPPLQSATEEVPAGTPITVPPLAAAFFEVGQATPACAAGAG